MNTLRTKMAMFLAAVALAAPAFATGTADTEVSGGLDNSTATWALIKTAIIGIVVGLIGIRFLRRVK